MRRGAIVLAGGRSRRMGRDKATLPFAGATLLEHVLGRLRPRVEEIVVVARPGQTLPALGADVRLAFDEVLDQGPLGGLVPGLAASTAEAAYASACDVPFVVPEVVDLLFERLGAADVAVIEAEGRLNPLAAVYRRTVLPVARRLLEAHRLRPVYLYDEVPTVRVPDAEVRRVDPELDTLDNLNTPEAYEAALARRAAERPTVTIELYERARQLAGAAVVEVEAATLDAALRALGARCPALEGVVVREGRLAPHWRASLGGRTFTDDPAAPLGPGDVIVLVSALAGG